jgi:hypothetical protein
VDANWAVKYCLSNGSVYHELEVVRLLVPGAKMGTHLFSERPKYRLRKYEET